MMYKSQFLKAAFMEIVEGMKDLEVAEKLTAAARKLYKGPMTDELGKSVSRTMEDIEVEYDQFPTLRVARHARFKFFDQTFSEGGFLGV